jgi:hypothetical protein
MRASCASTCRALNSPRVPAISSNDERLPPIWARPEPRGRGARPALSRKQIVDVARRFRDESQEPYIRYLLESGEFPMLSQFLTLDGEPPQNSFDDGLDWLLDGFAANLKGV